MPKIKTNRAAAKRFKKTGSGAIHVFKVSPQSHSDDQEPEAKTLFEKNAAGKKE
jgi:ribosomal protein L35